MNSVPVGTDAIMDGEELIHELLVQKCAVPFSVHKSICSGDAKNNPCTGI